MENNPAPGSDPAQPSSPVPPSPGGTGAIPPPNPPPVEPPPQPAGVGTPPPVDPAAGAVPPPQPGVPPPVFAGFNNILGTGAPMTATKDDRLWAMLIHLSGLVGMFLTMLMIPGNLLLPLVLWLLKRQDSPFVDDQGKEAVNFHITMTIFGVVCFLLFFVCVGMVLAPILGIFMIVVGIIASIRSNDGIAYRYPLNIRFIK